jgi:DNA-binding CsgD family transcriptional regulator
VPNEIQLAEQEATLLSLRAKGKSASAIAAEMRLPTSDVSSRLSKMAAKVRASSRAQADEAFAVAGMREEELWEVAIQPRIDELRALAAAGKPTFDRDLVGAAIKLMERQSKRLGLDSKPAVDDSFLQGAPHADLVEVAKLYNLSFDFMEPA